MPERVTGTKRCAHDICGRTFEFTNWGSYLGDEGWFHQDYINHWCPSHIPEWIPEFIEHIGPYRPSRGVPNIDRREHFKSL